jgi:hypothetical protein
MHWKKVNSQERGQAWNEFCDKVKALPTGSIFRHNQAGDLPKNAKGNVHFTKLSKLVKSAEHLTCWTYTHYNPIKKDNAKAIRFANDNGFIVNVSADNLTEADAYAKMDIGPVCVTLPEDAPIRGNKTPDGLPIVVCPAQYVDDMNCERCQLCHRKDRKSIVGFLAHGTAKKRLSTKLGGAT